MNSDRADIRIQYGILVYHDRADLLISHLGKSAFKITGPAHFEWFDTDV